MLAELGAATVLFTLPLAESSGLAVVGDLLLTHEDSGGPSVVAVFQRDGTRLPDLSVDAENVDWEDLSVDGDSLFVGDIGDNRARRASVAVHRVPLGGGPTTTYRLTYADGPVDAEGLVVRAGQVAVVSKELLGGGLFTAPLRDGAVLERVADVPVGLATGAALSPDGTRFAVRDYAGVSEWQVEGGDLVAALEGEPVRSGLPATDQGEAVAYDGPDAVITTTEGEDGPVHRLVRQAAPEARDPLPEVPPPAVPGRVLPVVAVTAAVVLTGAAVLAGRRRRR